MGNVSHWGKRTLSFRVKKKETGYYVVAQFETDGALLAEYERTVKLDEGVLRFLTVMAPPEPARPAAAAIATDDDDSDLEDA
jgi:small subunit ribosomal protein S6